MHFRVDRKALKIAKNADLVAGDVVYRIVPGNDAPKGELLVTWDGLVTPDRAAMPLDPVDNFRVVEREDTDWNVTPALFIRHARHDVRFDAADLRESSGGVRGVRGELILNRDGAYMLVLPKTQEAFLSLRDYHINEELRSTRRVVCRKWQLVGVRDDGLEDLLLDVDVSGALG